MARDPRRPPLGMRSVVVLGIALLGAWSFWMLDFGAPGVSLGDALARLGSFFGHALSPALHTEGDYGDGTNTSLLPRALEGARLTLVFALTAMSVAIPSGLVLGFLASSSWWEGDPAGATSAWQRSYRRAIGPTVLATTRAVIGVLRAIHELVWATLFLAAFGLTELSAVFAIAIPYAGTLAKVYSEMLDEAPRDTCVALRGGGASPLQVFAFGLVPRALPDMATYTLYRFECALRSSAVLGFFGWATLGMYVRDAWLSNHYASVWTYLYALIAMVVLVDVWSAAVRKRLVA